MIVRRVSRSNENFFKGSSISSKKVASPRRFASVACLSYRVEEGSATRASDHRAIVSDAEVFMKNGGLQVRRWSTLSR